jgi:sugar phosphate isomerase/epimerase
MIDLHSRRDFFAAAGAGIATAGLAANARADVPKAAADEPFGYCLNTSTIMGQKLPLVEELTLASKVGYQAVEPWVREIDDHVKAGGSLKDLGKRVRDLGLSVESVIGFFEWVVDDDSRRQKALDEAKRNMEMIREIGGKRLAAPPVGATDRADLDLNRIAERYRALLELGDTMGVVPQVEVWGFSKTLGRLGEAALVAIESGHRSACILADVYHLYKGGSSVAGLRLLNGASMHVLHFNDYPASPPRDKITDASRVYPGDGVAPLADVIRNLNDIGYRGVLSLELFNRDYWKLDALTVLRTGLEKMKTVVRTALAK